jgi:hypothetical protein
VIGASPYLGECVWNPDCTQPPEAPARAPDLKILTYNIGNSLKEAPYPLRLRDQSYEDYVGEQIRAEAPDIVLLQEVLSPTHCADFEETSPDRTCFNWQDRPAPVQRLLGDDYTIACDANEHVECIGVRKDFGSIDSLAPGEFGLDSAATESLPGNPCSYLKGDCNGRHDDCDAESSISTVLVTTEKRKIRIVHAHPTAIGEKCLEKQVKQSFALVDDLPAVVGGDWNFDPTRYTDAIPASIWNDWIGKGRRFHSHDMRRGECRLERTSVGQDASLDRVATDFAEGRCRVLQDPRLDEGFDFDALDGQRIDHFAVFCDLYYREEQL